MLHRLQMGPSKVLTTFPPQIQSSWQLTLLELSPSHNTVTTSSDSSDMYTSTVQSGYPLLMLHSRPTLVSKPLISHLPILYLLHHCPCSWPSLYASCLPLTSSGFFNGMLEVFKPGALNYFIFSRPILSTLSASRNPILTHLPLSGFLDSLLCVLIAPTPGLAFSRDVTHARSDVVIFIRQGLFFSELSTSLLSSLDPYSDGAGINISLNNSSSFHNARMDHRRISLVYVIACNSITLCVEFGVYLALLQCL